jgi:hypothetical protein
LPHPNARVDPQGPSVYGVETKLFALVFVAVLIGVGYAFMTY